MSSLSRALHTSKRMHFIEDGHVVDQERKG